MLRRRFATLVLVVCALMLVFGAVANAATPAQPSVPGGGAGIAAGSKSPKAAEPKASPPEWSTDQIVVKLNPSVASVLGGLIDSSAGVASKVKPLDVEPQGFRVVTLKKGVSVEQAIAAYSVQPGVSWAQPDFIYHIDATPNDPRFGELWGLNNTGQLGGTPSADIGAVTAWNTETGDRSASGPIVAVVDTGVDYTHPDLAANMWTNPGEIPANGIDDDLNGLIDDVYGYDFYNGDSNPMDDHGHGTHCSGTIGGVGNNGVGVVGVNWAVRIMALKSFSAGGSGSTVAEISAIDYANDMGADVISNSWGGGSYDAALKAVIDASDAVVVCAAGNDYGNDNDANPHYPSSYESTQIVAVAATDRYDLLADFSSVGATSVDVAAPGVDILSTAPTALVPSGYQMMSGTSMATPHVAGLAALVLARNAALDNIAVKRLILQTAEPLASLSGMCATGARIDAAAALADADAPPTLGGIKGSVVDTDTLLPIGGLVVRVHSASDDSLWRSFVTTAGGTYEASDLPAGDYIVEFVGGHTYIPQYWENSETRVGATAVTVGATTVSGIDAKLTPIPPPPNDDFVDAQVLTGTSGSVSGHNINATVEPDETYGRYASVWYKWTASTDGTLSVDTLGSDYDTYLNVYSGATLPTLIRLGYNDDWFWLSGPSALNVPVTAGETYYVAVDGFGPGDEGFITLNWGFGSGHVKGRVTSQSSGEAIEGAAVSVARYYAADNAWYWFTSPDVLSDSTGAYDIRGLPAGDYRISFEDPSGRYVGEWYNGVSSFSVATTVTVGGAETRTGIDASLLGASGIFGAVTAQTGGAGVAGLDVEGYRSDGAGSWYYVLHDTSDAWGDYGLYGLTAGDYRVFFSTGGSDYLSEWYDGATSSLATTVTVGAGEWMEDVNASLLRSSHITGTVTVSTGVSAVGSMAGVSASAYRSNGSGGWVLAGSASSDSMGRYDIGGLAAGDYRIFFSDPSGRYAPEYYNGVTNSALATIVTIGAEESKGSINASLLGVPMRLHFATDGTPDATVSVETQNVITGGASAPVTATAPPSHDFVNWTGTGSFETTTANPLTVTNVTADATITAHFALKTFEIVPTAGAHGAITPNTTQTVDYGASRTFTFTPDTGYHVATLTVDASAAATTATSYTFTDVKKDHTIGVTFAADAPVTYTITPTAGAHGAITPNTPQTVAAGASKTFTFTPDTGYHVATLTVDASAVATTATSYTFTAVAADHAIGVTFAADEATVLMPVWRFRNKKLAGTYLWTASATERNNINATMSSTWQEEGEAFSINTANPLNKDPLWRFLKTTTWTYFFTATEAEKNNTIANLSSMWGYEGAAFSICLTPQTTTIWRFRNASTNTFLFTGDVEKALVIANNPEFALEGPAFWIAP